MSGRLTPENFKAMSDSYWERNTVCRASDCEIGWVKTDRVGFWGETETEPCKVCKGTGVVKRQLDMFPETVS